MRTLRAVCNAFAGVAALALGITLYRIRRAVLRNQERIWEEAENADRSTRS